MHLHFSSRRQCGRILGCQCDGFIQFQLGVGFPSLLGKNQPQAQIAFLVFRIVFYCLTKKFFGRNQVAVPGVYRRQISARLCKLRLQVKCRFQPLLRGLEVAFIQRQSAQFGRNLGQLRVDADCLAEHFLGALHIVHGFKSQGEIVSSLGAARILFEHVAINLRCLGRLPRLQQFICLGSLGCQLAIQGFFALFLPQLPN